MEAYIEIPVFRYDLHGQFLSRYRSHSEASKTYDISTGSITRAIENSWQAGGYQWRKEYQENIEPYNKKASISRKISVGNVYDSEKYGKYTVTRFSHKDKSHRRHFYVKFDNTGFEEEFNTNTIMSGKAIDYMHPSVHGVACLGARTDNNPKVIKTWRSMIRRCYGEHEHSDLYSNVSVCERWLNFQNFNDDVIRIDGYNKKGFESGLLVLDKDFKQMRIKHKIYSLGTCTFLTKGQNSSIADRSRGTGRCFVALSPDGVFHKGEGVGHFSRKMNMSAKSINQVISAKSYFYKGWFFGDGHVTQEELEKIKETKKQKKE